MFAIDREWSSKALKQYIYFNPCVFLYTVLYYVQLQIIKQGDSE